MDNNEVWIWRILFVLMTISFVYSQVEIQERQNLLNDARWDLRACACSNEVCLANNENYRNRLAKRMYEDYKDSFGNVSITEIMPMTFDYTEENQTEWEIQYEEE